VKKDVLINWRTNELASRSPQRRWTGTVERRPATDPAERRKGVLLLVTVVLVWGLFWPVNKVVLESLTPLWSLALRSAIAVVALFGVALACGRLVVPPRADLPVLISITLLHIVGFTVLSTWALQILPAGRSAVLAYTTPLWVTPGATLFLREPLTVRRAVGVAIGLLGLFVLFNPLSFDWSDGTVVVANAAILLAALMWAASILHIRGHRWQSTPFALVPWEFLLATVILTSFALVSDGVPVVAWNARLVSMLLFLGIPGTALAYWAIAMASRHLPAVTTSLGLLGTPVVSIIFATLWLQESPSFSLVAAIFLILCGVAIGTTGNR